MRYIRAYNIAMRAKRRKLARDFWVQTGYRFSAEIVAGLLRTAHDLAVFEVTKKDGENTLIGVFHGEIL